MDNSSQVGLGCPTAPTTDLGRTVAVYRVWLSYDGVEYLYYVALDGSAVVPCDAKIPPIGTGTTGTTEQGVQSSCRIDATLANIRSAPDSTADNIVGELRNGSAPAIGRTNDSAWYQITLSNGITGWIAASASTAVGSCATLPVTAASAVEFGPCPTGFLPDYLPPRIAIGDTARIEVGGDPNVVRQQPARTAERVGLMNGGTAITILSGPLCGGNYVWWQVTDGTMTGWTVESYQPDNDYFIELVQRGGGTGSGGPTAIPTAVSANAIGSGSANPAVSASNPVINSTNAQTLTVIRQLTSTQVATVAYSPDGRWFAAIEGAGVTLYSYPDYTANVELSAQLTPSDPNIRTTALAFSSAGDYLILGYNIGTLWGVNLGTGAIFKLSPDLQTTVNAIEFDANNRMAVGTGAVNPTAQPQFGVYDFGRFDANTGDVPRLVTVFPDDGAVLDVAFVGETAAAYMGLDYLRVVDIATSSQLIDQPVTQRGRTVVIPAAGYFGFSGLLAVTGVGNNTQLLGWNIGDAVVQSVTALGGSMGVDDIAVVPGTLGDGPFLAVAVDATAQGSFRIVGQNTALYNAVLAAIDIEVSPDGRHIALVYLNPTGTTSVQILAVP